MTPDPSLFWGGWARSLTLTYLLSTSDHSLQQGTDRHSCRSILWDCRKRAPGGIQSGDIWIQRNRRQQRQAGGLHLTPDNRGDFSVGDTIYNQPPFFHFQLDFVGKI